MKYLSFSKHSLLRLRSRCRCPGYLANFHSKSESVSVICSKSNCPFENLALEEHIYDNFSFEEDKRLLYLWRNRPSVVIGRHQNPWLEVNTELLEESETKVDICRRVSGGGTVYHDLGNLNLTFFTDRTSYDRKQNLQFIIDALNSTDVGLDLKYNDKDDILLDDTFKVSGSAAKLGLKTAFHHCTLLCDTDLPSLSGLLRRTFGEVDTNATKSNPSPITNLFEGSYCFEEMCELLNRRFKSVYNSGASCLEEINPLDFESVEGRVNRLKSWDWLFGKTPVFTFTADVVFQDNEQCKLKVHVRKGVVRDTEIVGNALDISEENEVALNLLLSSLVDNPFSSGWLSHALPLNSSRVKRIGGVT